MCVPGPGALAEDPKLLLLDELTTFLDVEDQFGVLQAVKSITQQRRDVTAVWVTHRSGASIVIMQCNLNALNAYTPRAAVRGSHCCSHFAPALHTVTVSNA